jgi:hypothetical protein
MQLGVQKAFDALKIFGDKATSGGLFKSTGDVLTYINVVETLRTYIESADETNLQLEKALSPKPKEDGGRLQNIDGSGRAGGTRDSQ